jgi:hypothetical protein
MVVSIGLPEDSRHAVRLLTECEAFLLRWTRKALELQVFGW